VLNADTQSLASVLSAAYAPTTAKNGADRVHGTSNDDGAAATWRNAMGITNYKSAGRESLPPVRGCQLLKPEEE